MNIYDVTVDANNNVSKIEKDYANRFLLLNENHFIGVWRNGMGMVVL